MKQKYDYIIIGSGFGGSVSALRLAEKGYRVLVLEKGKWFHKEDFPRSNWNLKRWLWMPWIGFYGIMKMSFFKHITILSGTGVGGGSLVYANTLPVPEKEFFQSGSWKNLADWETELRPFYKLALKMLGASPTPFTGDGDHALKTLALEIGREKQYRPTHVAVFFGKENKTVKDPYFKGKGPDRTGCNFCGGCMTGCRYNAKNTLDKNYLHLAMGFGAEIIAEQEVIDIKPIDGAEGKTGYIVTSRKSTGLKHQNKSYETQGVIFAGGVLGTVKLMLQLKQSSLPLLSSCVGTNIRTNNESLILVTSTDKKKDFSRGVAIGSIIQTDKDSHLEVVRYSSGSGFWRTMMMPMAEGNNILLRFMYVFKEVITNIWQYLKILFVGDWAKRTSILLFMQHLDSTLSFIRGPLGTMQSRLDTGKPPSAFIDRAQELAKKYAKIITGRPTVFLLELFFGIPSTAHILGGAVMGKNAKEGVINAQGHVFYYHNMLVCDGSMISANPGVNPSLTITAITERTMKFIPRKKS